MAVVLPPHPDIIFPAALRLVLGGFVSVWGWGGSFVLVILKYPQVLVIPMA